MAICECIKTIYCPYPEEELLDIITALFKLQNRHTRNTGSTQVQEIQVQRMSKAEWGFLENLLEGSHEYSTAVGRVWLTVLFLFRVLVLCAAAESAWDDEQSDFVCNTKQPGCESVCYDKAFPVSHFRYFILQVVFVSTPSIFFFVYVAMWRHKETKKETEEPHGKMMCIKVKETKLDVIKEENEVETQEAKKKKPSIPPKLKGKLLGAYAISIAVKVLIEIGFVVGLWFLYGFVISAKYECERFPCPHKVDCFVSRPTEKTIFTIYIQVIALVSVLLNVLELFQLLQLFIKHYFEKKFQYQQPGINPVVKHAPLQLKDAQTQSYQKHFSTENSIYAQYVKDWPGSRHPQTRTCTPNTL
ncbi:gap junction alpha-4 protein [Silurus asotus]|uniref:Gap junction protein n=1 Tax=Silurus asotus TaxID=30991 RepID=A0AAD5AGZ4_SILAS|nr:gap junction alpha-4 protein [Silurus asotus]